MQSFVVTDDKSAGVPEILLCHLQFSGRGESGWIGRDAGGDCEQHSCSPGQAEEKVPQPVHPPDQQHRAGSLRPAERDAGVTGDRSLAERHGHGHSSAQGQRTQRGSREPGGRRLWVISYVRPVITEKASNRWVRTGEALSVSACCCSP